MKTLKILSVLCITALLIACDSDDDAIPIGTIDLDATSITFTIVKDDNFTGTATITGTITNNGDANFNSNSGQQAIRLYQRNLGTPAPGELVDTVSFTNLDAGETLIVNCSRPWNSSSPAEGEFPPDYRIVIDYDPDIFIDGNDQNNDSDLTNNDLTVSGSGINDLFRN
ncbi:hypothetical protein D1818_18880 [Aquimarina sp. BL5]|uniref:hypothetical protein n=1 Tax=Aquimarina sp. BL5 TaxID=1714860 RepID=UPI000E4E1EA4|nr:hypothetical protein [Aquimarina sp. BL5]AXT52789.1 hypothetical protein D1818_18880 [Aquimarina sp. BL5]RKN03732.1 hypothetical protein D7036_13205 [Aquimarina sp. BL5]